MPTRTEFHEEVDALPEAQLPTVRLVVDPDAEEKRLAALDTLAGYFAHPIVEILASRSKTNRTVQRVAQ
jgi:hypothetical protein